MTSKKSMCVLPASQCTQLMSCGVRTFCHSAAAPRAHSSVHLDCALQEEIEVEVTGDFPHWLDGLLIRNGPGTFKGVSMMTCGHTWTYMRQYWLQTLLHAHRVSSPM